MIAVELWMSLVLRCLPTYRLVLRESSYLMIFRHSIGLILTQLLGLRRDDRPIHR